MDDFLQLGSDVPYILALEIKEITMMTTDNSGSISEDQANHVDNPNDDNGKVQSQIDREDRDNLVKAEVSAPISESQVQPGREAVDGNGRRDLDDVEPTRGDVIVDPNIDTQAKRDAEARTQEDHARKVQDKQNAKLNANSKSGQSRK